MFPNNSTFRLLWSQFRHVKPKIKLLLGFNLVGLGLVVGGLGYLYLSSNVAQASVRATDTPPQEFQQVGAVFVDVSGAVVKPGVYMLRHGQHLVDALQAAGGVATLADYNFVVKTLNLAQRLKDGDKIFIPFRQETVTNHEPDTTEVSSNHSPSASLNNATMDELDTLPGIGTKRAEEIIAGRPYSSVKELVDKEVISQSLFLQIQPFITL